VIEANLHIRDPDNLAVGQEIIFPSVVAFGKSNATRVAKATLED